MAEDFTQLNPGQGGDKSANYRATDDRVHQKVILEMQSGSGDPVNINNSNPMPVTGTVAVTGSVTVVGSPAVTGAVTVSGDVASAAADTGNPVKVAGVFRSSPITLSNGQRGDLQLDTNGYLKVNIAAGAAAGGTSSTVAAAAPATATAAGFTDGTNMQLARVFDADTGGGTEYVQGVVLRRAASGGSVEVGTSSNPLVVGGAVAAGAAASGNPVPMGGLMLSSAPTYSNGQLGALQVDASGNLKVNIQSGGGSGGTASTVAAAVPSSATAAGFSDGTNMQLARVFDVDTGGGTIYVQGVSIRLAGSGSTSEGGSTSAPLAVQGNAASAASDSGNPVKVGGRYNLTPPTFTDGQRGDLQLDANGYLRVNLAAGGVPGFQDNTTFTAGTSQGMMLMGYLDDASSSVLTENNAGAVRMTSNRALHVTPRASGGADLTDSTATAIRVMSVAGVAGGHTPFKHISAAAASAFNVKNSAGKLHWLQGSNNSTTLWAYAKLYNSSGTPTPGAGTIVAVYAIPPNGGFNLHFGEGISLATGIAFTIVEGAADANSTALALNQVTLSGGFS